MKNDQFLNYTHGLILQGLCEQILQDLGNWKQYRRWILKEQESMRKKQPTVWSVPKSAKQYYKELEKLASLLRESAEEADIQQFLEEVKAITRKKLHIIFLTQETFCWPSLESVFKAATEEPDVNAAVIYTPFFHKNYTEQVDYYDAYKEMGVPILRHNEYDLVTDSPDVAFMIKPYANVPEPYTVENINSVVPRIVYIPYGMEITTDLIRFGFQYYGHYKAWRHCAYGQIVKDYGTKYGYRNGENLAVWGHPKADHYRDLEKNRENIPPEWKERIGGRKVVLWTPHHLIDLNENGTGTWLIWGEHILKAAQKHPELFFIVRPHPLMMGMLVNTNALSQAQADRIRQSIDNAENMLWDPNDDYRIAFDTADAIITDGTTFSVEFLYTKKPIILTPRNMEGFYFYREMLESYYIVNSIQDISAYMDMIAAGEDPLREKRYAMYEKAFFVPKDCTVGENIIRQTKAEVEKECAKFDILTAQKEEKTESMKIDGQVEFPLVSILVLCYKNQELLYGMLDTIFRQDYPRIQLIVSDDGSEDFDEEAIRQYIEMNQHNNIESVLVRTNETNMRTVPHIHHAMQYVEGEYLVFTAADDRFYGTDAISAYVEQFLRNPDKMWLVAKCRVTTADYSRTLHYLPTTADEPYFSQGDAALLFSRWSRRGMAIPCCMAFRTKAIESVGGFDLDYLFIEDWPLELKLLRGGNAPIFCDRVTALHSAGGITNSNKRYGKEIRRLFYEDKYTLFRKEVEPYKHLLTKEDKKAYRQYMREIMQRHYFFYIDWPDTSAGQKLKLFITKPIRAWWVFEQGFEKISAKLPKKLLLLASQAMLVCSMFLLNTDPNAMINHFFRVLGWAYLGGGLLLTAGVLCMCMLGRHFKKKEELRHRLVN